MVWGRSTSPTQKYVVDQLLPGRHQSLVDQLAVIKGERGRPSIRTPPPDSTPPHQEGPTDALPNRGCLFQRRSGHPSGRLGISRSGDEGAYGRADDLGAASAVLLSALVDRGHQTVVHADWDDPCRAIPDGAASSLLQYFDVVSAFRFVGPFLDHLVGDRYAINGLHITSVIRNNCLNVTVTVMVSSATYSPARSILPICRIFSRVAASAMSSAMLWGTTCQDTPQRSTHQPQRSASGTADSPVQ